MKKKLKLKSADNLEPIRNQLSRLVGKNARVIEFGCGNGDLLLQLSSKIHYGLGIDKSENLIKQALLLKKRKAKDNLDFICKELKAPYKSVEIYDFSIASLFFHTIPRQEAISLLHGLGEVSNTIILCGISRPNTMAQKLMLWLDQGMTNHFNNFITYHSYGYLEGILKEVPQLYFTVYDTVIPFIKIYKLKSSSE